MEAAETAFLLPGEQEENSCFENNKENAKFVFQLLSDISLLFYLL